MKTNFIMSVVFVGLFIMFISCNNDDNQIDGPSKEKEAKEELPANEPPSSFDLIKVIEDEIVLNLSPTFSWEKAQDPEGDTVTYDFYLAKKEEELKVAVPDLSDTILDYDLSFSEEYNWKVVAKDGKGGSTESKTFSFSTRNLNVPRRITNQTLFGGRTGHSVVSFKNRLLLINGSSEENLGLPKPEKDLWYSDNVTDWSMVGDTAAFAHRYLCTPLKFNEKLYIIGGASSKSSKFSDITDYKNDVWASTDGLYWQKIQTHAIFSPRTGHSLVVFKEKMWMFGGIDENGIHHNDLYVSDDGVAWSSINMSNQGVTPRAYAKFIVFNDKLYLIGGGTTVLCSMKYGKATMVQIGV
ncbi:kelch repeat-containing protein [Zobellia russellii]|uniref:Kelch repeat-containing protein n=1 Tax=Zobellia russellii TaxID=248907 RepID=UPI0037DCDE3B